MALTPYTGVPLLNGGTFGQTLNGGSLAGGLNGGAFGQPLTGGLRVGGLNGGAFGQTLNGGLRVGGLNGGAFGQTLTGGLRVGGLNGGAFGQTLNGGHLAGGLNGSALGQSLTGGVPLAGGLNGGVALAGGLNGGAFSQQLTGGLLPLAGNLNGGAFGQPSIGGPLPLAGGLSLGAQSFGSQFGGVYTNPYGGPFGDPYGGHSHFGFGNRRGFGGGYGRDDFDINPSWVSRRGTCGRDHYDDGEPDFLNDPDYCRVTRVTPFLFLTNKTGLCDRVLERLNITLVIAASESHEIEPPTDRYCDFKRIPVPNDPTSNGPDILQYFDEVADLINREQQRGGCVIVHSLKGRSRGPTLVVAYLMKYQNMALCEAFGMVHGQRQVIRPFYAFWKQLIQYEKSLYGRSSAAI